MRRLSYSITVAATIFFLCMFMAGVAIAAEAAPDYLTKQLSALGSVPEGTWLAISKGNFKLFVLDGKNVVESFGVAVGKNKGQKQRVGDNKTPEGMFEVIQIQNASYWTHDFRDGKGEIKGAYGPWFIRLGSSWRGIGIHGTHDPSSIGTAASEGCIRMKNEDVQRLRDKYAKIGLKVFIFE